MTPTTPTRLARELKDAFLRYFDTAFWLDDEDLMRERAALLEAPGALVGDVMLEPVVPYPNTKPLLDVAARVGIDPEVAARVGRALFPSTAAEDLRLRDHQADALVHSMIGGAEPGRNVVVTSGTGSGKTESFLLPVLVRLVQESMDWKPQHAGDWWWEALTPEWRPMRHAETRAAAVRTLVLYPTNALVEDQMTRLRRAVRSLRAEQPAAPLWFGRYTSGTIGSKDRPAGKAATQEVGAELRRQEQEYREIAAAQAASGPSDDVADLSQFPDPRTGEMMTRWDMVAHPPDILVTNYSMLNTIMMRSFEAPIFEATARWLRNDVSHVFTLVVDGPTSTAALRAVRSP